MPMPGAAPVMRGLMPQLNQKRDVAFVDSHTVRDTVKLKNWISSSKQSKVVHHEEEGRAQRIQHWTTDEGAAVHFF